MQRNHVEAHSRQCVWHCVSKYHPHRSRRISIQRLIKLRINSQFHSTPSFQNGRTQAGDQPQLTIAIFLHASRVSTRVWLAAGFENAEEAREDLRRGRGVHERLHGAGGVEGVEMMRVQMANLKMTPFPPLPSSRQQVSSPSSLPPAHVSRDVDNRDAWGPKQRLFHAPGQRVVRDTDGDGVRPRRAQDYVGRGAGARAVLVPAPRALLH
ncbi:hypothetical protein F4824DRAFT_498343 [Ustulina deusta]|nr:hypothetical protein F4824DRAFT_498343 [Ustulina deusta]